MNDKHFFDTNILFYAYDTCVELLTEDFNDGQDYDGVRARNPFRAAAVP
jgi:predicted nucleic acid-binding protein